MKSETMSELSPQDQSSDQDQQTLGETHTNTRPLLYKFKVCLLGDFRVGKTSLIQRYVYDVFSDKYLTTIGMKVTKKEILVPFQDQHMKIKLLIWDIMGQKDFTRLQSLYYQSSRGAIIVSDLTRKETLDNIPNWISRLYEISPNIPLVIVTNKHDLQDEAEVTDDGLMEIAEAFMAPYYFTSAKTGENVDSVFQTIARNMVKKYGVRQV